MWVERRRGEECGKGEHHGEPVHILYKGIAFSEFRNSRWIGLD
jgi:hypothetical protein